MSEIFVTGHKNPDTDTIVAAIAYANLKNALGGEYKPVRLGSVSDETQRMLDRFGFEAPELVRNMRNQVKDLNFDRPPELNRSVSMDLVWRTMRDGQISSMPILNDDGTLFGLISSGDIASFVMQTAYNGRLDGLPVFNLLSVLEGAVVNDCLLNTVSGRVRIALPQLVDGPEHFDGDIIAICGNQPELVDSLLEQGVRCIIICQAEIQQRWTQCGGDVCILATPLSARKAARLIYHATPVERVCLTEGIVSFHMDDYVDDVRDTMLKARYHSYPVLDRNEKVIGTLSRFHLLRPKRKQVVLVDHNEAAQSVPGLDQVEIMEIIDHHRLADIQTVQPISVRNEPVGSTNTIITAMYRENGIMPSPKMAGLMAAAILSDTVMFKSPTCTRKDISTAERLAKIAGISLEELGKDLFSSSGMDKQSVQELFSSDYKQFHISGQSLGIGQITCADASALLDRSAEFFELMAAMKKNSGYDMIILMITDVLSGGTWLLYDGDDEIIQQAFSVTPKNRTVYLPSVMSRKKQIVPMLTELWG